MPKFWCPSTGTAPVSPGNHASWTQQGAAFNRKKAVLTRISSASSTISAGNGGLSGYTSSGYQWVYGPIAAGTISGTCATRVRGEADIFIDLYTARVAAWIAKPDLTSRGTLISPSTAGSASQWTTSFANYDNTFSCSSVTAVNGDYLVLEVGVNHAAAVSDDGYDIEIGDNSATNTNFFDFSDTDLVFWAPAGLSYLENPARYKNGHTVTNNTVTSTGGPIDSYAVTAGSLPPGLSLNSVTGTISGTPTTNGTYTFTVTATNDGGTSAVSVTYTIYTGNSIKVDKLAGVEVKVGG